MVKNSYYLFFFIISFFGVISYGKYNLLPANVLFELLVLVSFGLVTKKLPVKAFFIFLSCIGYVIYTFLIAKTNSIHPADYFLAFKSFIYISILCFFCRKKLFNEINCRYFFQGLLIVFFFKYIFWLALNSFERPGLYTENNFELIFLLMVAVCVFHTSGFLSKLELTSLVVIVFLSGSRSGLLALFAVLFILYIKQLDFKTLIKIILLSIFAFAAAIVFIARLSGGGIESIDRFVFVQGFVIAVVDWGLIDFLTGAEPLTALPEVVCQRLSYYEKLFSIGDPSKCYSNVLHSYIIRMLFDHGILGLLFIFWSVSSLLKLSNVNLRSRLAVLSILLLNGLSVSSLNSVYAMLGLIFILSSFNSIDIEEVSVAKVN